MKHVYFFATKEDILPILQAVESKGTLKYVRTGNFTTSHVETIQKGSDIPDLGKATSESASGCESFLVCKRELSVEVRHVKTESGVEGFLVDQVINPDTVGFTAGGLWKDDVLLNGRVATVSETQPSQELMRRFHAAIRKHFVRIKAFWVGPEAMELLKAGKRLAGAAQSPREYDLIADL